MILIPHLDALITLLSVVRELGVGVSHNCRSSRRRLTVGGISIQEESEFLNQTAFRAADSSIDPMPFSTAQMLYTWCSQRYTTAYMLAAPLQQACRSLQNACTLKVKHNCQPHQMRQSYQCNGCQQHERCLSCCNHNPHAHVARDHHNTAERLAC
jgi:hypothetical protein